VINIGEEPQRSLWQGEWRLLGEVPPQRSVSDE
jgi:hypothetical protein